MGPYLTTRPHRLSTRCDNVSVALRPGCHAYTLSADCPPGHQARQHPALRLARRLHLRQVAHFGLGKHTDSAGIYMPKWLRNAERYTVGVDIWSLAIVFAKRAGGLPDYQGSYKKSTTAWNKAVVIGALVVSARGTQRADPVSPR